MKRFRPGLAFSFFNAITWQIALGTPMVLYAEQLGASTVVVGVVYSFVFLLTPLQVAATFLLPRFGFKRLMEICWLARSFFLLPLIWLAWRAPPPGMSWAIAIFMGCIFAFCLFRAIGSCSHVPWMYSILPESKRGSYFASEQLFSAVSSVSTLLACAYLFRVLTGYEALLWEFAAAFAGSLLALFAMSRMPDGRRPKAARLDETWAVGKRYLTQPSTYRYYLVCHVLLATCVTALPPFAAYYLKSEMGVSSSLILLLATTQSLGVIGASLFMKQVIDKVGPRPVFMLALTGYIGLCGLWLAVVSGLATGFGVLLLAYIAIGVSVCFWFSANLNYMPYLMDETDRPLMVSVNSSVVSLVSGLAPVAWGFALKMEGENGLPAMNTEAFRLYFAILGAVCLGLIFALSRIHVSTFDPDRPFRFTREIWRPFRAITFFASNYPEGRYEENGDAGKGGKQG